MISTERPPHPAGAVRVRAPTHEGGGREGCGPAPARYSFPTTWATTWDISSWGLNSTIRTASSTTIV